MKLLDCKLLDKNITRRQNHLIDSGHVGCCEIVVRQNGTKILHKSFGCEQNLMYRLASMTKPVTAVAVLSEVQKGRLSLDDKVSKFFQGFADQYVGMLDDKGNVVSKEKVKEEIGEFEAEVDNMDKEKAEAEFGDVMFSLINAARLYKINPDNALERTNQKFIKRFNYLEEHTLKQGRQLTDMSLAEMDAIWNEAKKL